MNKIIPVTDLQRQAASILKEVNRTAEPVIITQRGRASAVLISAKRYAEIEEHLALLDDLELVRLIQEGEEAIARGETISHEEVKKRLNFPG
jgi:prevent-host-death family protein